MSTRVKPLAVLLVMAALSAGCAAGQAFRQGNAASRTGDWDQAVAYYRTATQADPDNPNYKIALERAQLAASRAHFDRAKTFEEQDQLEAARGEYQLASEYDPANRQAAAKIITLDQTIRARIEAARPRPAIEQLRQRARAGTAEPLLNPASREPLRLSFRNANIRDILDALGIASGINVTYDPQVPQTAATVQLDGVTLEQALQQIMAVNQLAYKVTSERSILVFPDNAQKHAQYDEQVVQTFYVSHADVTELTQLLSSLIRLPSMAVQPAIQFNKAANTITVRGTASVVQIIERIIAQNDKARAEIMFDVEILEVNRSRAKQYGLNLSEYALGGVLSPEVAPGSTTTGGGTGTPGTGTGTTVTTGRATSPSGVTSPPPFNLNTISRGFTTSDFYLAVPTAIVRALESDTQTKLVAKPQLRGAEGNKLTLNLGDEIPIVSTSYTPIATGGVGVNPLNSFQLKPVGINIDITPVRVTLEGDILIDLNVESSSRGSDVNVAGTNYPSFGSRKVGTRLRLRDGESNLLAGLLREDERKSLNGFPGAIRVPILRQLFSNNDQVIAQTDIVMLLTPHILRAPEITESDLRPIYIGSQGNLGIGGPPPLIAAPPENEPAAAPPSTPGAAAPGSPTPGAATPRPPAAAPGAQPTGQPLPPPGTTLQAPPGTTPVPGTVLVPTAPPPAAPASTQPPPATAPDVVAPPGAAAASAPAGAAIADTSPLSSPGLGVAQVLLTPPSTAFRVGGGPYTMPISVINASRLSMVTLTLTFDPGLLRIRAVNEGSFMRSGGANATFTQQTAPGRVDITIARAADATGATGTGLLGAVLFDAVAPGAATFTLSGSGTGPGGTPMGLQFRPANVTIQP